MTEQQAISKIQYRIDTASEITGKGTDGNAYEDLEIAIQALSEIQQYRAIGTPTQIYEKIGGLDVELGKYHAIGTIEECRTAVERMKPKRPNDIVMAKDRKICVGRVGKCPCCGSIVAEDNFTCEDCFQVLDWSE